MTVATTRLRKPTSLPRSVGDGPRWIRPAAWLSLPDITGQQRFVGLHRIDVDGNFVALSAQGNYTVDWGDGTTNNYANGATAYKQYDYTTISSTGESTLGYRQVIIQVYPQAGQNLVALSLQARHNQAGLNSNYATGWLDIAINGANVSSLNIGGAVVHGYLQQATITSSVQPSLASLFFNCLALQSVQGLNTAGVTNMTSMFNNCYSLQYAPFLNTSSVTNMTQMFINCYSLIYVPLYNTASVTNMTGMFNACYSLASVPLLNTSAATTTTQMFLNCYSLTSVPAFNTGAATDMSRMFQNCFSLQTVPLLNTANATSMSQMFSGCSALTSVPAFNMASASNISSMFSGCAELTTIPTFGTSAATNVSTMFNACSSLVSVPAINVSAVTTGNFANMFASCPSLASCGMTGINQTISFLNCKLSAAQINAIFNNLSASGSGKTITVTGNYGAASCTTSIATAKGWTVAT